MIPSVIPSGLIIVVGWLWPSAILFLTGVWFVATWGNATWFSQAVPLYAPVVFGISLLLAWRFGQSRVSAVLVGLALLNYLPGSPNSPKSLPSRGRSETARGRSTWTFSRTGVASSLWHRSASARSPRWRSPHYSDGAK